MRWSPKRKVETRGRGCMVGQAAGTTGGTGIYMVGDEDVEE